MNTPRTCVQSRRQFVYGLASLGGLGAITPPAVAAEPPPETTKLRIAHVFPAAACAAPEFVAEELLRTEGFTDIQYIKTRSVLESLKGQAAGETDLRISTILPTIIRLDAG